MSEKTITDISPALSPTKTEGEFSVYWSDPTGTNHCELRCCCAEEAVDMAISLVRRPAAKIGTITQVMITDGMDFCNWHWKDGSVIFDGMEDPR